MYIDTHTATASPVHLPGEAPGNPYTHGKNMQNSRHVGTCDRDQSSCLTRTSLIYTNFTPNIQFRINFQIMLEQRKVIPGQVYFN